MNGKQVNAGLLATSMKIVLSIPIHQDMGTPTGVKEKKSNIISFDQYYYS